MIIQRYLYFSVKFIALFFPPTDYILPSPSTIISRLARTKENNRAYWNIVGKITFVKKVQVLLKCMPCDSGVKDGQTGFLCWKCGSRSTLQPYWSVSFCDCYSVVSYWCLYCDCYCDDFHDGNFIVITTITALKYMSLHIELIHSVTGNYRIFLLFCD